MNMNLIKCFPGLWVTTLLFLVSCEKIEPFHEDGSEITAAEAVEIVRPILRKFTDEGIIRIWTISKDPIPARSTLKYGPFGNYDPASKYCGTFKSPNFKAWLVMIRPEMIYDGSSDEGLCVFVNVKTGEYTEISIKGQVSGIEWDRSFANVGEIPPFNPYSAMVDRPKLNRNLLSSSSSSSSGLYAVIISGGVDMDNNFSRYWNNCQYIYQRLTQTLGYDESHIYCLVADGTSSASDMVYAFDPWTGAPCYTSSPLDFDNDGDDDIQYSATKANISAVFNLLQSQAASIDHLLVFVTDHGTPAGKICLWGSNQEMSPTELYAELDKLPGVRMDIVLGQCYSGAFIPAYGGSTRTFTTACSATEQAWSQGYFSYGFFLRSWTDAFDPTNASTVDTNNDNMISLREAFVYAAANDPMAIDDVEHPQYASFPLVYGYTHDLLGADNCPVISGSNYLSCNASYSYTISGVPSSASVTWASSSDINLTSPTNTSVTAQGSLPTNSYVSHHGNIMAYFTLEGTQYYVMKEISSIWKPGYYNGNSHIYGGSGHYAVETGEGAYGYQWSSDNSAWVILYPWGSPEVTVSEGPTMDPVTLWVTFQTPMGSTIVTSQQFNTSPY